MTQRASDAMRRFGAMAAALVLGLGVAACEGQIPLPQSQASSSADTMPDMTEAQEKRLRKQIFDVLEKANDAKSADRLDERLSGPALQVRTSQLNIAKKTGKLAEEATIPTSTTQTVIPTDNGWPRTVFTITTTTADQQANRLLVMKQDSARTNYKLWALARLLPGAQLPKFAVPKIGSQMGEANDSGLKLTPTQAAEQYADVLEQGSKSKYASAFADDYFRKTLTELNAKVQEGMKRNDGTQTQTYSVVDNQMAVMRSSDGGDLVVAQINSESIRKTGAGRESLPASDAERALFGDAKATSTIKVNYVNVIVLYIPPASSDQKVTAVGAEQQPISVKPV